MKKYSPIQNEPVVLIHACNAREWYVYEYLVPAILQQGLPHDNIIVWHDYKRIGNLHSFIQSLKWLQENMGDRDSVWHIQDDVIISRDFVQRIRQEQEGIMCGFCCKDFNPQDYECIGQVPALHMWNSFQCIKIPIELGGRFVDWVLSKECLMNQLYFRYYKTGKMDDTLFRQFVIKKGGVRIYNMTPNIVDHVDFLIGGSIINGGRKLLEERSFYWGDQSLVDELRQKILNRNTAFCGLDM